MVNQYNIKEDGIKSLGSFEVLCTTANRYMRLVGKIVSARPDQSTAISCIDSKRSAVIHMAKGFN